MSCLDPPWGQRLSVISPAAGSVAADGSSLCPSAEGGCLTQSWVPAPGVAHIQRLGSVVYKDQVLLSQWGTSLKAILTPGLSVALAKTSVAAALQVTFSFGPVLLPSHPLGDTSQYITSRHIPSSKFVSGGDGPGTLGKGRDARKHMLKCSPGAGSSTSQVAARTLSLVGVEVLIECGML